MAAKSSAVSENVFQRHWRMDFDPVELPYKNAPRPLVEQPLPENLGMDKSTLKVHLPDGSFNVVRFGDATDIKVSALFFAFYFTTL